MYRDLLGVLRQFCFIIPLVFPGLPVIALSDTTYTWGAPSTVDIHLDNFLESETHTFSQGTLVQLSLTVPSGWPGGTPVTIWTSPVGFANGVGLPLPIPTSAGPNFTLHTTPEPTTTVLALLGLGFGGLIARRRRKTQP